MSLCFLFLFSGFKALPISPAKQRIAIKGTEARKSMCICRIDSVANATEVKSYKTLSDQPVQ